MAKISEGLNSYSYEDDRVKHTVIKREDGSKYVELYDKKHQNYCFLEENELSRIDRMFRKLKLREIG